MRGGVLTFLACGFFSFSTAWAVERIVPDQGVVVKEINIKGFLPKEGLPRFSRQQQPIKITDEEELARAIPDKELREQISKQVDFTAHYLVLFAWSGSGGDRVTFQIEGDKKQPIVMFEFRPGRTADLRGHCHLYAIVKKATLRMKAAFR